MTLSARSRQLDLFRGLAAVFMIVNHAGYHLLDPIDSRDGWSGVLVFIGSAAPALFFFATGVGSGISTARAEALASAARKVLLLLVADTFMNWGNGVALGLDFFGFAAIATAAMFLVRLSPRPVLTAIVLLVLTLAARFGLSSVLRGSIGEHPVVALLTGIGFVEHVSYPLCPWLAFPLLGFLVGRHARERASTRETIALSAIAVVGFVAAGWMAAHGAVVHRWGTVSLAYFLFAVAIVATAWLLGALLAAAAQGRVDGLMLRGPASLLIVPLHYGALGLVAMLAPPPWGLAAWAVATAVLVVVVLVLARRIVAVVSPRLSSWTPATQGLALAVSVGASGAALLFATPLLRLEVACAAEVVVAIVLMVSASTRLAKPALRSPC